MPSRAAERGKKAFDLHANTYRVDADVVPTFEHRRYSVLNGSSRYISGTELHPDGGQIVNWPHQNYENVTSKNNVSFAAIAVRLQLHLQLHALAYNLANFMRTLALPGAVAQWSLTGLRKKLVKIGAKVV